MKSTRSYIEIIKGRVHNLKEVTLRLPHRKLIVVTGVSGSGKSSLVFHLLYAEAYRRYMSILESSFVRNFIDALEKPDVDKVNGLQAVIGIGQEISSSRTRRSTVGTLTDIYAFLRLLYARIADAYSHLTGNKMQQQSEQEIENYILAHYDKQQVSFIAPLVTARKGHYKTLFAKLYRKGFRRVIINDKPKNIKPNMRLDRYKTHSIQLVVAEDVLILQSDKEAIITLIKRTLSYGKGSFALQSQGSIRYFSRFFTDTKTGLCYHRPLPNTFSFNSSYGACPTCHGSGTIYKVNKATLIPDRSKSIMEGGIPLLGKYTYNTLFKNIDTLLDQYGYSLRTPIKQIPDNVLDTLLHGTASKNEPTSPNLARFLLKKLNPQISMDEEPVQIQSCSSCLGARLKKEALQFKINQKNIAELCEMNLNDLDQWLTQLPEHLSIRQQTIGQQLLSEIHKRVKLMLQMGLHYLQLNRPISSLSGGEIRRIRIAAQIGTQDSHLVGIMYVLDEPSIGLHPRDNHTLIDALKRLRNLGNTVIVIEHDRDTMLAADYLVEVGPGAGEHGGTIVAQGTPQEFLTSGCTTAKFLHQTQHTLTPSKRRTAQEHLTLTGCTGYTLKNVTINIPLSTFIAVTGVSGSGKSSLIHGTLVPTVKQHLGQLHKIPLPYKSIQGVQHINKVIEVTQAPIGRTQRSNVATYTQLFNLIRDLFTQLPQSKVRGYKPQRFSFNIKGGRCENCKGAGSIRLAMDFLPDVRTPCNVCHGRAYNRETLEVKYKGKSIADVLAMTVAQAIDFFDHHPQLRTKLQALKDVGLGYIRVGHPAPELSGGEAQRVKLAAELTKKNTGKTLYVLDEPTTGLHFQDVQHLAAILQKIVDKGSTVICIEHNIDFIKTADHVIDLGPEAGSGGGHVIATGTPEELANNAQSATGVFLKQALHPT